MSSSARIPVSEYFMKVVIPLHLLLLGCGIFFREFRAQDVLWIIFIYFLVGGLGLELGFHRLLSHNNFRYRFPVLEKISFLLGALAFQGSSLAWVALHRNHHIYVDSKQDHQSPVHGLWSSYIGWTVSPLLNDKIKVSQIKDILRSKFHLGLNKYYYIYIWSISAMVVLISPRFFFNCYLPGILLSFHVSSINNLIGHNLKIGKRPFRVNDWSTDVWWAAIFSWGISYQNTHHRYPTEINYGRYSGGIDPAYWIFKTFDKLKLIKHEEAEK